MKITIPPNPAKTPFTIKSFNIPGGNAFAVKIDKSVNNPSVELHITDLKKRDDFRKKSVIAPACIKQISGLGKHSYLEGVKELISL